MGHLLPKSTVKHREHWKARGNGQFPAIAIQVPVRLHNKDPAQNWIHKPNTDEVWLSLNGKIRLTYAEWQEFKQKMEEAFQKLETKL